jgi:hypothetical protein
LFPDVEADQSAQNVNKAQGNKNVRTDKRLDMARMIQEGDTKVR